MRADVAELCQEREEEVILTPDRALGSCSVGISRFIGLDCRALEHLFRDFRQFGDEEEDRDADACAGDGEVNELHVCKVGGVLACEEELASDQGANKRRDAVPGLAELESGGSRCRVTDNDSVRVGCCLEGSETACDDEGADAEAAEGGVGCVFGGEVGGGPEGNGADGVEGETHEDGDFIAFATHNFCRDGGEDEISATEVHDLETGALEFGYAEDILEVFVQDVKKAIGEAPEEEKGDDEGEWEDEGFSFEEA